MIKLFKEVIREAGEGSERKQKGVVGMKKCPYCEKRFTVLNLSLEVASFAGRSSCYNPYLSEFNCPACKKTIVVKNNDAATKRTGWLSLPIFLLPIGYWIFMRHILTDIWTVAILTEVIFCLPLFLMLCRYFGTELERK